MCKRDLNLLPDQSNIAKYKSCIVISYKHIDKQFYPICQFKKDGKHPAPISSYNTINDVITENILDKMCIRRSELLHNEFKN